MKWTLQKSSAEFGAARETIKAGLVRNGVEVRKGRNHAFTTKQILAAIFGDLKAERTREARARADLLELKRREREAELVPLDEAKAAVSRVLVPLRTELLALPSSIAARCNPGDPELARKAIHESVTRILQNASDEVSRIGA